MKIMAKDSSASVRQQAPHLNETTLTTDIGQTTRTATIINALKQRAQAVLSDVSIDAQTRAVIRHGLKTNDSWLAELVSRTEAYERAANTPSVSQTPNEQDSSKAKIEALAEIICAGGDESAAALLVLMGTFQNSTDPKVLAHTVKHFAFTRCGELNVYEMLDAQIAVVESALLSGRTSITPDN
jgi:hypothetical protein